MKTVFIYNDYGIQWDSIGCGAFAVLIPVVITQSIAQSIAQLSYGRWLVRFEGSFAC